MNAAVRATRQQKACEAINAATQELEALAGIAAEAPPAMPVSYRHDGTHVVETLLTLSESDARFKRAVVAVLRQLKDATPAPAAPVSAAKSARKAAA